MSTELAERPVAKSGTLLSVTEETIAQMAERFASLKINGINDKAGFLAVDTARKECKKARSAIATEHATLKADALKVCQTLDSMKRNLTGKVEAIENRLVAEIEAVEAEKARIQKEKDDAIYNDRVAKLAEHGTTIHEVALRAMTPAQFAEALAKAIADEAARKEAAARAEAEEVERKRIATEQAEANRIEAERLKAEREELARRKAEQDAEAARIKKIEDDKLAAERAELKRQQDELQAERDRLAREESERQRAAKAEQERLDRIERERIAEEQRKAREADEAAERVAAELRAEQLKPIKQRIMEFADKVQLMPLPDVPDSVAELINHDLLKCSNAIRYTAASLA